MSWSGVLIFRELGGYTPDACGLLTTSVLILDARSLVDNLSLHLSYTWRHELQILTLTWATTTSVNSANTDSSPRARLMIRPTLAEYLSHRAETVLRRLPAAQREP